VRRSGQSADLRGAGVDVWPIGDQEETLAVEVECGSPSRGRRGVDDGRLKRWPSCCRRPWLRAAENGGGRSWDVRRHEREPMGSVRRRRTGGVPAAALGTGATGIVRDCSGVNFSSSLDVDCGCDGRFSSALCQSNC
jgi:hypothetical protein